MPHKTLQQYFGYATFRPQQETIVRHVLQQQDALVLMPTGGGKSICYQLPALLMDGLTVVISPLIALMKDQVDALRVNGIQAAFLNSTLSSEEQNTVFSRLEKNQIKLLYLAPERLLHNEQSLVHFLKRIKVSLIAVDEAHCISHWGHDFRPEYRMLAQLRRELPDVPFIALTATADKLTREDIVAKLELKQPGIFISSFNRPNIRYTIEPKRNSFDRLLDFLTKHAGEAGIIYCLSRQSTESIAGKLQQQGYRAAAYHAGLERKIREERQEQFLRDETLIMVATIAFGMGIDKSNVRYVVHMDLPKNIEGYYQETGRAGRDGLPGEALLFYSYADVQKLQHFATIEDNEAQSRIMLKKLDRMSAYCQARICRRQYLLNYFDEDAPAACGNCDICLGKYQDIDGSVIAQKVLSAVSRLNQSFGMAYVIDLLRGSKSTRIREHHKQLKTYGIGADISKEQWLSHIDDLIALGYLKKSDGEYPVLQLTEKSAAVLRGAETVMLRIEKEITPVTVTEDAAQHEEALFDALRKRRREIADRENVPAFVIVSDATLMELATYFPQDTEEISHISGFGEAKIQKYGSLFCELIQAYCRKHDLSSRINQKQAQKNNRKTASGKLLGEKLPTGKNRPTKTDTQSTDTKTTTLNLYREGKSITEIATLRELTMITVENHLAHFIENGALDIHLFVPAEKLKQIKSAASIYGMERLAPLKDLLGADFSYTDIRMAVAHMKAGK